MQSINIPIGRPRNRGARSNERHDAGRRSALRLAAAGAMVLALPAGLAACSSEAVPFNSTDVTGADIGKGWSLSDVEGKMRSASDFTGKVAVVFFGFIQCPDVCPTTLAELVEVRHKLGAQAEQMQVLFVTVDPERDTPDVIREYLAAFDPSFIGLRGDAGQLQAAAKSFKAFYAKVPGENQGDYTMDHSSGMYLFDTSGAIRLYARGGHTADQLAADIRQLLQ